MKSSLEIRSFEFKVNGQRLKHYVGGTLNEEQSGD